MTTTTAATTTISEKGQQTIQELWQLQGSLTFSLIKQSENHTFQIEQKTSSGEAGEQITRRFILRLTPRDHRSKQAIQAELEYILLLASQPSLLRLCTPIALAGTETATAGTTGAACVGQLVPYESSNTEYYAVLFEYAKGSTVLNDWRGLLDDKIVESWGKSMAELHKLISCKAGNPTRWNAMQQDMPLCEQTHSGATDIDKTIKVRATAGHLASKMLLQTWEEKLVPFFKSLGEPTEATYGVIHGDWNVSNFFSEDSAESGLPHLWLFDFDQAHKNWLAFDIGVVLHSCQFFKETGWAKGFDGDHYRKVFLDAYRSNAPKGLMEAGHLEPAMLDGFQLFREFYHCGVAVDILFQAESGKHFENAITSFCKTVVERFQKNFGSTQ